nr:MAG TPA: hypothetical protein [Caudoviricetes sp.]
MSIQKLIFLNFFLFFYQNSCVFLNFVYNYIWEG